MNRLSNISYNPTVYLYLFFIYKQFNFSCRARDLQNISNCMYHTNARRRVAQRPCYINYSLSGMSYLLICFFFTRSKTLPIVLINCEYCQIAWVKEHVDFASVFLSSCYSLKNNACSLNVDASYLCFLPCKRTSHDFNLVSCSHAQTPCFVFLSQTL